jgi:hypothetical protein
MIAGYTRDEDNSEQPPGQTGEEGSPSNLLRPEARQALDSYLLTLCQYLHQGLLELRDNLVEQAETEVLEQVQGDGIDQVQQALSRLGEPQGHANRLIRQLSNPN